MLEFIFEKTFSYIGFDPSHLRCCARYHMIAWALSLSTTKSFYFLFFILARKYLYLKKNVINDSRSVRIVYFLDTWL